ncbi:hypothetical protein BGX31_005654 [Mortierella sp. GBA43]|nr:hypothetical protein BGX31_005654 [Mortierella sp. GBA43]
MSTEPHHQKPTPAIIIVGAGLGGLMMAILLERLHIPYHIFERATTVKPLGAAMSLGASILPVFEQLGLLEEIKKISFPCRTVDMYDRKLKNIGSIDQRSHKTLLGYESFIFARPRLYELLLSQVPPNKISLGKKVLRTREKDNKVHIFCSDNTSYEGDILIGADGAYSGVRQSLYKQMDDKGLMPSVDLENFSIGFVSMVGVAQPKDPEKYPQLKDPFSHFSVVVGEHGRNYAAVSVPDNQICWGLGIQLSVSEAKDQQFRNSEWGPESNEAMIKEFKDMPCPWGGTMGDMFDDTPKHLISKVFLEEKNFKTWYHGRTVLIGDGLGAVNAMHDAVVLVNCLHDMPDASPRSIKAAFQEYYEQRHHRLDAQIERSGSMTKIMGGQTKIDRMVRHVILNYLPSWVHDQGYIKSMEYRPQIAWLPLTPNRGTGKVLPQEGDRKNTAVKKEQVSGRKSKV